LVSGYAHVFVLLSVVVVPHPVQRDAMDDHLITVFLDIPQSIGWLEITIDTPFRCPLIRSSSSWT